MQTIFRRIKCSLGWRRSLAGLFGLALLIAALIQPGTTTGWEVMDLPRPKSGADVVMLYLRWAFALAGLAWGLAAVLPQARSKSTEGCKRPLGAIWPCLVVIVLAVGVRWPLMRRDIGMDEQYDLATAISGHWKVADLQGVGRPGKQERAEPEWRPVTWYETIYGGPFGSNSPPHSMLVRGCLMGWRALKGKSADYNDLVAMRLPALGAYLGFVVLLWLAVRPVGLIAAVFVCVWMVLHPATMEYGTSARSYSLVLLLELAALLTGWRAIKTNGRSAQLGCHLCCGGLLWTYPGTLWLVVVLEVTLFFAVWKAGLMWGWVIDALWATGILLPLALPSAIMRFYAVKEHYWFSNGAEYPGWPLEAWNALAAGWLWPDQSSAGVPRVDAGVTEWSRFLFSDGLQAQSCLFGLSVVAMPVLLGLGFWRLLKQKDRYGLFLAGVPFLAGVLTVAFHTMVTGYMSLWWYFIFALPGIAVGLCAGLKCWVENGWRGWVAAIIFLSTFTWLTWPDGTGGRLAVWSIGSSPARSYQRGMEVWTTLRDGRTTRHLPARPVR
jgi:hypothetical protein